MTIGAHFRDRDWQTTRQTKTEPSKLHVKAHRPNDLLLRRQVEHSDGAFECWNERTVVANINDAPRFDDASGGSSDDCDAREEGAAGSRNADNHRLLHCMLSITSPMKCALQSIYDTCDTTSVAMVTRQFVDCCWCGLCRRQRWRLPIVRWRPMAVYVCR